MAKKKQEHQTAEKIAAAELAVEDAMQAGDFQKEMTALDALRALDVRQWTRVDDKGDTPLMIAARAGDVRAVSLWLDWCDPKAVNKEKSTALMEAVAAGVLDCVQLLAPVSDISARNVAGGTVAHIAIHGDRMEIIQLLVETGLLALTKESDALFHWAARYGSMRCLRFLAAHCDQGEMNASQETPLWRAITEDQAEAAVFLAPFCELGRRFEKDIEISGNAVFLAANLEASQCLSALLREHDWRFKNGRAQNVLEAFMANIREGSNKTKKERCQEELERHAPIDVGRDYLRRYPTANLPLLRARVEGADIEAVMAGTGEKRDKNKPGENSSPKARAPAHRL